MYAERYYFFLLSLLLLCIWMCLVCMLCLDVIFDLNSNKYNNFFLFFHFRIQCQAFSSHKLYGCCWWWLPPGSDYILCARRWREADGALKFLNYAFAVFSSFVRCFVGAFFTLRTQFSSLPPPPPAARDDTTRICVTVFCSHDVSVYILNSCEYARKSQ